MTLTERTYKKEPKDNPYHMDVFNKHDLAVIQNFLKHIEIDSVTFVTSHRPLTFKIYIENQQPEKCQDILNQMRATLTTSSN